MREEFRNTAKEVIDEFSVGDCTLVQFYGETYDPDQGKLSRNKNEFPLPYAIEDIVEKIDPNGVSSSTHTKVVLAGLDVDLVGANELSHDDIIVLSDGSAHGIYKFRSDQYDAKYEIYIYNSLWQG